MRTSAALIAGILLVTSGPGRAEVRLLGAARIPGDATDKSELTDTLPDGTPHNRLGSHGSAIAYTGEGDEYLLLADRGPSNGTVPYRCRMHRYEIRVPPGASPVVDPSIVATTLLTDERDRPLLGLASAFDARFDPEGIRVGPGGSVFISDEYGPYIYEFDARGKRRRSLPVPPKFAIARPDADPAQELKNNTSGRVPNRGLEGLALTPDGSRLFAAMQSPLIQDGGRDGLYLRFLEIDVETGSTRELVYPLESKKYGVSEILAVNGHEFLVVERDGKGGAEAKFKKVFAIDIRGASDVGGVERLPKNGLPPGITPVRKREFLDLLDPRHGLAGPEFPAKIEGLAFGPDLPDGRRLLLVTSDNDFVAARPTWVYAFGVDAAEVPGFERPRPWR
jgi:hypothetical protein